MPPAPKLATFPAIRGALRLYQICSIVTGTFLLLLVGEMILKYTPLQVEVFFNPSRWLYLAPVVEGPHGQESTGQGLNVSMTILIVHGWFYVVYLFSCFRVWSLMRWPLWRFLLLAAGGVVPFLSFIMEGVVARDVRHYLAEREASEASAAARAPLAEHSTLTQAITTDQHTATESTT